MTYEEMADKVADAWTIPRSLFRALIQTESGWNAYAIGPKGEIGLTQLMPTTASELGVNAWDAGQNLQGGAKYLATQFKKFGDWAKALAAYNAGPGNIAAGANYATTVLAAQKEIQKNNPSLDQVVLEPEQNAWKGSVGEQVFNWILNGILGGDRPTPIGKTPSPDKADPLNPTLPKPTDEQTASFQDAASSVGKYFLAGAFVLVSVGVAVYVLATSGAKDASKIVKKTVS